MRIEKVQLKDLKEFYQSARFSKFEHLPISGLRVASYLNNPNGSPEDVVLYLAIKNKQLIGYKTIFLDKFKYQENEIKFGWLSGTWTHNDFRRSGVSLKLFNEVYNDWEGRLMYTNYAVASKKVYDKSSKFSKLKSLEGFRYYSRFYFRELLPPKSIWFMRSKNILGIADNIFNAFFDFRFKILNFRKTSLIKVSKINNLSNTKYLTFLEEFKWKEFFCRNVEEIKWIENFPWIKSDDLTKQEALKYYFSSYSKRFESSFYELLNKDKNELIAIICININDERLTIPYAYFKHGAEKDIANFILEIISKEKISCITIYNSRIVAELDREKYFFFGKKKFNQSYFITKKLLSMHPKINSKSIQSGDGDVVFS